MIYFNILNFRYFSYIVSLGMIILFCFGIFYKKKTQDTIFSYSIEFTGGYQISCMIEGGSSKNEISSEEFKHQLETKGYNSISIRSFDRNHFLLRFSMNEKDLESFNSTVFQEKLIENVKDLFSDIKFSILDTSFVGPGIGKNMCERGIFAILIALLFMFLYVWMRFPSWKFSFANVISLLHDVLIILLLLMWFNIEISLDSLIAILFIIGYSINDTIVIFSAIREQMYIDQASLPSGDIIVKGIIATLRRTLLTSFFTALVVIPLWLFGGYALKALAIPILIGIIFGTYSSIAIASTVLHDLFAFGKKL